MHQTLQEQTWDETDFVLFYQQYASPILDHLRVRTRTLEDAEDILLDVFLAARQAPHVRYETARGQLAWLRQVARNKLVDAYRRGSQIKTVPLENARSVADPETASNPEQALVQTETLAQLQATVQSLPAPPRATNGRRVYDPSHLRILGFIRRSRELGFSLAEIRALIRLGGPDKATCREVREIAAHHLEHIRAKLDDLRKLERLLAKTVTRCTGKAAADCPVLDILDIRRPK